MGEKHGEPDMAFRSTKSLRFIAIFTLAPLLLVAAEALYTEWSYPGVGDWQIPPRVHDLDGDLKAEVLAIASGTPPSLVCLSYDGRLEWQAELQGAEPAGLALGDINGDSLLEVVAASSERTGSVLSAFDSAGKALWTVPLEGSCTSPPMAVDLDWDGHDEVVVVDEGRGLLCFDGRSGELLWVVERRMPGNNFLSVADLERSGRLNILWFQNKTQSLWIVDSDGSLLRTLNGTEERPYFGRPMIGDLEPDGALDLLILTGEGVICIDPITLGIRWETELNSRHAGALADVDADGGLEAVIPGNGRVTCLESDGSVRYVTQLGTAGWAGSIVIGNIDGDPEMEAVFPVDGTQTLHAIDATTGYLERSYASDAGGTFPGNGGAAMADGDWDGVVELYLGTSSAEAPPFLCISTLEEGFFTYEWPQHLHDWRGTSNYETTIQTVPEVLPLLGFITCLIGVLRLHQAE